MKIEINNKQYPIRFGTAALRLFCREKNLTLDQFTKHFAKIDLKNIDFASLDDVATLVLCGVKDGLRKEKRKDDFDLEVEDFYDYLDDGGDLEAIFAELNNSMPDAEPEGEKEQAEGNQQPVPAKK